MNYKYFKPEELKCNCDDCYSVGEEMSDTFMRKIEFIRGQLGFPFYVMSAYRCSQYNNKVSTTGLNGPHTTGRAMDIGVRGEKAYELVKEAYLAGFTGIGIQQTGESRFIHLDDLTPADGFPRPFIWSYK